MSGIYTTAGSLLLVFTLFCSAAAAAGPGSANSSLRKTKGREPPPGVVQGQNGGGVKELGDPLNAHAGLEKPKKDSG